MKVRKRPLPLNSLKIDHALAIGDVWLTLVRTGKLQYFKYEPIDPFTTGGRQKVYAPDAFFIYKNKPYLLELQLSPLSTIRWGEKWAVATSFFDEGHYKKATWQVIPNHILHPAIIVLSNQSPDVIQGGSLLNLSIIKEAKALI